MTAQERQVWRMVFAAQWAKGSPLNYAATQASNAVRALRQYTADKGPGHDEARIAMNVGNARKGLT